ncbi:hypothetical protein C8Q80DRAFT_1192832 [Daedaleopsis nitida]|nr:hypothetical protein C8Q80DRAFT_1192832 [Daedaleopsis nitida]
MRALALVDLPPSLWSPFPLHACVEVLWLGPSHAKVDWRYLPCAPRLLFDSEFRAPP